MAGYRHRAGTQPPPMCQQLRIQSRRHLLRADGQGVIRNADAGADLHVVALLKDSIFDGNAPIQVPEPFALERLRPA